MRSGPSPRCARPCGLSVASPPNGASAPKRLKAKITILQPRDPQAELDAGLEGLGAIAKAWVSTSRFKAKAGELLLLPDEQARGRGRWGCCGRGREICSSASNCTPD